MECSEFSGGINTEDITTQPIRPVFASDAMSLKTSEREKFEMTVSMGVSNGTLTQESSPMPLVLIPPVDRKLHDAARKRRDEKRRTSKSLDGQRVYSRLRQNN